MASIEKVQAQFQVSNNVIVHDQTVYSVEHVSFIEGSNIIAIRARKAGTYTTVTFEVEKSCEFETLVV